ncbi:MAG: GNAT family N-acetyltransferase, partial [Aggregatilineales bacterium]
GIDELIYRAVPHIYHRLPAEEDLYALYVHNAQLLSRTVLTVVDSTCRPPFQERRRRGAKKALKHGLTVRLSQDYATYWSLLTDVLMQTYGARPVHTLAEIASLHACFPRNIKLYAAYQGADMLAGAVIYESERVARAQYIAASEMGKALGALDLVFDHLLNNVYANKPFFDFGSSKEAEGPALNTGLLDQKEGFGGRAVVHDYYALAL